MVRYRVTQLHPQLLQKLRLHKLFPLRPESPRTPLHTSPTFPPVAVSTFQAEGHSLEVYVPESIQRALPDPIVALGTHATKIPKDLQAYWEGSERCNNYKNGDAVNSSSDYKKVNYLKAVDRKMASSDVALSAETVESSFVPLIQRTATHNSLKDDFNPDLHLNFREPVKIYTMKDLKLPEGTGVSSFAVSEPFSLFTADAIMRMREEVLSKEVLQNCQYSSNLAQCQLRGYAAKYAPFVYDTWKHPETLAIISKIAGVELMTEMDFEIGHVNISVKSEQQKQEELQAYADKTQAEEDEGIAGCPWEDDRPIVDWHTDSYPFVCVTMLSECTDMIGGETALRTGTGEVLKVRGPQMGCAIVLQGRYIEHQALRALGAAERITMVTSFRPRHPHYPDDTVLTTVRPISNLSELYYQFTEYRLEILEERVRNQLKELRESRQGGKKFATVKFKQFLQQQEKFLAHMNNELIEDEKVIMGDIDDSHLMGISKAKRPKKRARHT